MRGDDWVESRDFGLFLVIAWPAFHCIELGISNAPQPKIFQFPVHWRCVQQSIFSIRLFPTTRLWVKRRANEHVYTKFVLVCVFLCITIFQSASIVNKIQATNNPLVQCWPSPCHPPKEFIVLIVGIVRPVRRIKLIKSALPYPLSRSKG